MGGKKAFKIEERDNVATVLEDIQAGELALITDKRGLKVLDLICHESIPFGHKVAIHDIPPGDDIVKYGEKIGMATARIKPGFHVHVHNLESTRARGDWEEEA